MAIEDRHQMIALLYYPAFNSQKYPPRAYALVMVRETPTTFVVDGPYQWLAIEQTRERNPVGTSTQHGTLRYRKTDRCRIGGFGGWRLLELFVDAAAASSRMKTLAAEARKAFQTTERSEESVDLGPQDSDQSTQQGSHTRKDG